MLKVSLYDKKPAPSNIIAYVVPNEKDFRTGTKILGAVSLQSQQQGEQSSSDEIELHDDVKYQLAPRPVTEKERSVLFVAGEAGAGKSYFVRDYAKYYNKLFPKNPIYLISYLDYDETLDSYEKITRINAFTVQFLDDCMKIHLEEFRDSLIIFDDIDSIFNKHMKAKIFGFLSKLLRLGRHQNISVAYVGHELYASHELKYILNESHTITWFPKFLNFKKLDYLLTKYFGLSNTQKERVMSISNSRSVTFIKGGDKVILAEHEMFIL